MDLWITSQDEQTLKKVTSFQIIKCYNASSNPKDFTFNIIDSDDYVLR